MTEVLRSNAILAPVVALVAWSLIMLVWLDATRLPAMRGADPEAVRLAATRSSGLLGAGGGFSLVLAWLYVGLRVAHSLVQATINVVALRFLLFLLSSLCLIALTIRAILVLAQAT